MISPYFNVWLGLRKENDNAFAVIEGFREAWRIMRLPSRIVIALFFAMDLAMIVFGVATAFDMSLLPVYCVCLALLVALYIGADLAATSFHRGNPAYSASQTAEFVKRLRIELRKVGLKNLGQMEYVRDEAIRLLDRKERRRASILRYMFDTVVLLMLASFINLVIALLEHDASLDSALFLLAIAVFVSSSIMLLVNLLLGVIDRLAPHPVAKLREFVEDMSALLVCETGSQTSRRVGRSRSIRRIRRRY